MLKIGFLRLGKFSSDYYIRVIEEVAELANRPYQLVELEVNFEEWNTYLPDQFEVLEPKLRQALIQLNKMDVEVIIIPNITLHLTFDRLIVEETLRKKICHPVLEIIDVLKSKNVKEVTFLGTKYSMTSASVKRYFERNKITLLPIKQNYLQEIDTIRKQVYVGQNATVYLPAYEAIIKQVKNPVIGCTELSTITTSRECFDMATIQILSAFKR